jgi:hypothetical protein
MEYPPLPPIDASISVTHYRAKIRGNIKLGNPYTLETLF